MLLIDENISFRIVDIIAEIFPGTVHVKNVVGAGAPDRTVAAYARKHGLIVVTKDKDWLENVPGNHSLECNVVYVKLPNCRTDDISTLLINNEYKIKELRGQNLARLALPSR
ncbi:DUF5615 family PIN-like protein [Rhodomicrobium sp. Az07]|uniref:DUF5615 family PIN-like protein n=1 Tax=Rhodomicrobium sp. Az07 TaxID=2839034 RepID=UPI001BEB7BE3|nr:DUF5615 family PIN-like protein [Rhodomicrobium sp. Az07]MBT3070377.1 DUF5615 family PIN-like protein [Rhodomicrobium sp. Az07]